MVVLFAALFCEMEADGALSCLNVFDMFCLHKVFRQGSIVLLPPLSNHGIITPF